MAVSQARFEVLQKRLGAAGGQALGVKPLDQPILPLDLRLGLLDVPPRHFDPALAVLHLLGKAGSHEGSPRKRNPAGADLV